MQACGMAEEPGGAEEPAACRVTLTPGENLLFAALRGWAAARVQGDRPHAAITTALARKTSSRTASLFAAWAQAVEAACRRPLRLTCPGCGGVSTDAQRLIVACGAAPVDPVVAEALLAPILRDAGMVTALSRALNATMAADGWRLPARLVDDGQDPSSPGRATRH